MNPMEKSAPGKDVLSHLVFEYSRAFLSGDDFCMDDDFPN
jgi:hypothetical protein